MSTYLRSYITNLRRGLHWLTQRQPFRALIRISLDFYRAQAILSDRPLNNHKQQHS